MSALDRISLYNYRNYRAANISLAPNLNVLAAENAQGKTNLLEAIFLLSTGRVLRGKLDKEAILEGEQESRVEGILNGSETKLAVTLESRGRKKAYVNSNPLPRTSDLLGRLPSVCISLEEMVLVRGEPADRRLALDLDLSALYPAYLSHLAHYKRALEQRNALLRQARFQSVQGFIEPWNEQLAEHGSSLRSFRLRYVDEVFPYAAAQHSELSDGEDLKLDYLSKDNAITQQELLSEIENEQRGDLERASTSVGPHRDDLMIQIDGKEARLFGSQGQQRTAVLALRLGHLKLIEDVTSEVPILLLDDILSDLDSKRRNHLINSVLAHKGQSILTCTDIDAAGADISNRARIFSVYDGTITQR